MSSHSQVIALSWIGALACQPPTAITGAAINGCPLFPSDNPWNQVVADMAVDPLSDQYLASMNASSKKLHPDFGADPKYGIPYIVTDSTTKRVPVVFQYSDESDSGPYPIPLDSPIEGGAAADGDRHVLAIDHDQCKLYELYNAQALSGSWHAGSGAIFDLRSNALRPDGWTSADAAGLPIFPGLVRYDEAVTAGAILHALRFTAQTTQAAYVHPATHFASKQTDAALPPMGLRVRLKKSYDLSGVTGPAKTILTALQTYGMILADNGSDWYISGATDARWNDDALAPLKSVPASAFEVVKLGPLQK